MTTENSTTPSLHFYRQAGGPQKDQPSPELSVRFHVFASGQEFEKEGGRGGVCPISIEHGRPRFPLLLVREQRTAPFPYEMEGGNGIGRTGK